MKKEFYMLEEKDINTIQVKKNSVKDETNANILTI